MKERPDLSKGHRTIFTEVSTLNRRQTAWKMFFAGATVDEVIAATGLKRTTANCYFWEAKIVAKERSILKPEPRSKGLPEWVGEIEAASDPLLD